MQTYPFSHSNKDIYTTADIATVAIMIDNDNRTYYI